MARYQVLVEAGEDGTCMAHVPELFGCFAVGSTREEALENLRRAIIEHLAWLTGLGEAPAVTADTAEADLQVVEEVTAPRSYPVEPGGSLTFFAADEEPMSYHDLQASVRLMERARRDLLEFLRDVPEDLLRWRPSPDEPSIAETLLHMAHAEASYLARLDDEPRRTPFPQLAAIRGWAYHRFGRLTEAELSRVTVHHGEKWSARKVVRRFLEHERGHVAHITSVLARYRRRPPDSDRQPAMSQQKPTGSGQQREEGPGS